MATLTQHTPKPRVLWIEDDLKYAKLLQLELGEAFDFDVHESLSPKLNTVGFDGVIIDMNLARGREGPQVFKAIRESGYAGPIFVLSNDESVVSKVEMLALGVDDYLWKVMPTEELELRLRNAIQRYQHKFRTPAQAQKVPLSQVSLGGLTLNLERVTATLQSQPLELSKLEFKILLTLFRNHPQPTGVETLKLEAWETQTVESGTLSTFFWKLNKKTEGWGYRIVRAADEVSIKPT